MNSALDAFFAGAISYLKGARAECPVFRLDVWTGGFYTSTTTVKIYKEFFFRSVHFIIKMSRSIHFTKILGGRIAVVSAIRVCRRLWIFIFSSVWCTHRTWTVKGGGNPVKIFMWKKRRRIEHENSIFQKAFLCLKDGIGMCNVYKSIPKCIEHVIEHKYLPLSWYVY